jgi:carboxyl-terminal processing protease
VDGSVDRVADSLKSEFKTKQGRIVFDGGGLDPDIPMPDEYVGTITAALVNSGMFFEYATQYCSANPMPTLNSFHLADKDYNHFIDFLRTREFSYSTSIEQSTKQLIEAAGKERYYREMETLLENLKDRIEAVKKDDFVRFKSEILEVLEEQIAFHYALNEGLAAVSLSRDATLAEALRILHNPAAYYKTLTPDHGHHSKP